MRLSQETTVRATGIAGIAIDVMCHYAYKLWNVCNYERKHYKDMNLKEYPDWHYQKSAHKDDNQYEILPSQTAQEVCKVLDEAWKSFYALKKNQSIKNPRPPRYKHEGIPITYMQNGMKRMDNGALRLTLSKGLKNFIWLAFGIAVKYIYLDNVVIKNNDTIKQVKLYPPDENNECRAIIVYEEATPPQLPDNGRYLSIDLGINNPFTCYDNAGRSFILGHKYGAISHYYDKEIEHNQKIYAAQQIAEGVKYPKPSARVLRLYERKRNSLNDYFHKCTNYIITYCVTNNINTIVVGDITGIREDNDHGHMGNQLFHAFPFQKIYAMLEYKCALHGIRFEKVKEYYSSQCSPLSLKVSKRYAKGKQRVQRGLYKEDKTIWNADAVGAYNILRIFLGRPPQINTSGLACLSFPQYIHVAV